MIMKHMIKAKFRNLVFTENVNVLTNKKTTYLRQFMSQEWKIVGRLYYIPVQNLQKLPEVMPKFITVMMEFFKSSQINKLELSSNLFDFGDVGRPLGLALSTFRVRC